MRILYANPTSVSARPLPSTLTLPCSCPDLQRRLCSRRSYIYLHLTDEEEVKATNRDEEASREVGVPLQWSIATEISNSTTFVVRRLTKRCRQHDVRPALCAIAG